jgi:hypothetical protein
MFTEFGNLLKIRSETVARRLVEGPIDFTIYLDRVAADLSSAKVSGSPIISLAAPKKSRHPDLNRSFC